MARSWTLSPSAELDEAITWFRRRMPMGAIEQAALADNARRTAFWMSAIATKQRAARVQRSLEIAFANGMDFETWKRTAKANLRRIPEGHLQTTFRNWNTSTLNAARVNYLSNPQVMKRRPYWVFDATLDPVTTAVCSACDGTVLPAGHKWFYSHTPPLHHNCRSVIRGVTLTEAQKIGIRKRAPRASATRPAVGFGKQVLEPWQPTTKDFPDGFRVDPRPVDYAGQT